jgi:hypothetical protein
MAVPFIKIYHTPAGGVETDITELVNLQNARGLEIKSARAEFTINNSKYRYKDGGQIAFNEDDDIIIYADYSPITKDSSQLLISGQIQEVKADLRSSGSSVKLSVADKMNVLLGGLWSGTYTDKDAPEIIRSVVNQVASEITTNNLATLNSQGGAFSQIDKFAFVFKPASEWIKELSQPGYTGEDRSYLFYVDANNDLHWFYPSQTTTGSVSELDDELYNIQLQRSNDEVVNMVIFNAGMDLDGNVVLWYYLDKTSKSNKLRMKYEPMTDLSRERFALEIAAGNLTESASGDIIWQGKQYVIASSGTTSWGQAFSTQNDYKDKFRTRLKNLGIEKASRITERLGKLLWKGRIEMKGNNNYVAGDYITVNFPTLGVLNQKVRVWDVQQSFGNDAWITNLEIKEDEGAIDTTRDVT